MLSSEQINLRLVLERTFPRERGYGQSGLKPQQLHGSSMRRGSWRHRAEVVGPGLTELPEAIGQLSQLRELYLAANQLSSLPEAIGQLSQLQTLHLSATS